MKMCSEMCRSWAMCFSCGRPMHDAVMQSGCKDCVMVDVGLSLNFEGVVTSRIFLFFLGCSQIGDQFVF
jgi:hypothetical protein